MRANKAIGVLVAGFLLGGCMARSPVVGSLVTNAKGPVSIGTGEVNAAKRGEATSYAIYIPYLGSFAWGDSSIQKAARDGGITEVAYADRDAFHLLVFARHTTVVRGR